MSGHIAWEMKSFYVCEKCKEPIVKKPVAVENNIETLAVGQYDRKSAAAPSGVYHVSCLIERLGDGTYE